MKRFMSQRFRFAWGVVSALACTLPVGFASDAGAQCVGDCDGNGRVFIPEVQRCVNLNSDLPTLPCDNADQNGDGIVDENEVGLCIQSFLDADNCPMVFTPVASPTQTPTLTPTDVPPATPTATPTSTVPSTSTPTNTSTQTPTSTNTPTVTATHTSAPTPTNTSPPDIGQHECVFDNSSQIVIISQALALAPFAADGAIDVNCGAIDGATGKAPCTCVVQSFQPIEIIAIGFVCFTPGSGCDTGEIDCDGGNGLDVTMDSDHNIGTCTGNPDCQTQCETHCSNIGLDHYASGCEGFCVGGANDGDPCDFDSDCPGGSCPGRDGGLQHSGVCQCDCVGVGGAPSSAGALQCNLPVNINVEASAPCGDGDVTIAVGTRCIPLTSETVTSQLHDTNNSAGKNFPAVAFTDSGTGIDCNDLTGSITTGLNLVGSVNFFDSTIGDLHTQQTFTCQ